MIKLDEQYVISRSGRKVGVVLAVRDYRKLLEELEELESIRAYDAAKASGEQAIPFKQALRQLRRRP